MVQAWVVYSFHASKLSQSRFFDIAASSPQVNLTPSLFEAQLWAEPGLFVLRLITWSNVVSLSGAQKKSTVAPGFSLIRTTAIIRCHMEVFWTFVRFGWFSQGFFGCLSRWTSYTRSTLSIQRHDAGSVRTRLGSMKCDRMIWIAWSLESELRCLSKLFPWMLKVFIMHVNLNLDERKVLVVSLRCDLQVTLTLQKRTPQIWGEFRASGSKAGAKNEGCRGKTLFVGWIRWVECFKNYIIVDPKHLIHWQRALSVFEDQHRYWVKTPGEKRWLEVS